VKIALLALFLCYALLLLFVCVLFWTLGVAFNLDPIQQKVVLLHN
jgi:hypothetical protein